LYDPLLLTGCSDACVLRPSLQWIDGGAEAQGHATAFVAKFFGRAGLMSLLTAVPEPQRPGKPLDSAVINRGAAWFAGVRTAECLLFTHPTAHGHASRVIEILD
jgi:hypothetical protein